MIPPLMSWFIKPTVAAMLTLAGAPPRVDFGQEKWRSSTNDRWTADSETYREQIRCVFPMNKLGVCKMHQNPGSASLNINITWLNIYIRMFIYIYDVYIYIYMQYLDIQYIQSYTHQNHYVRIITDDLPIMISYWFNITCMYVCIYVYI